MGKGEGGEQDGIVIARDGNKLWTRSALVTFSDQLRMTQRTKR